MIVGMPAPRPRAVRPSLHISVDGEADGPIPGPHPMLGLGAPEDGEPAAATADSGCLDTKTPYAAKAGVPLRAVAKGTPGPLADLIARKGTPHAL